MRGEGGRFQDDVCCLSLPFESLMRQREFLISQSFARVGFEHSITATKTIGSIVVFSFASAWIGTTVWNEALRFGLS